MTFNNPYYLLLIFLIGFIYLVGLKGLKEFSQRREKFIAANAYKKLKLRDNLSQKYLSILIWISILILLIIALARPQFGEKVMKTEQISRDIVIAVDISDSMKATDVSLSDSYSDYGQPGSLKNISRLEAAKKVINGIVRNLNGERISLVAFSENAFPLSPLSSDYSMFSSFLNNLDYTYSSGGGTNIAEAITVGSERFYDKNNLESRVLIIVSDGEEQNNEAVESAKKAFKNKVTIETIGIGSKTGSKIYTGRNLYGEPIYKTYLGEDVISKLNDNVLKDIAKITKGKYFEVKDEDISNDVITEINKIKAVRVKVNNGIQKNELFQIFVLIAIFLIMLEIFIPALEKIKTNLSRKSF